ncbi:MAG: threonine--tRNA ligase [Candidatus Saccharimonadales bacterium]
MPEENKMEVIRHSLSHLMTMVVEEMYPGVGLGVGPAVDDGFYQDYDLPQAINQDILPKIEKRIKELIKQDIKFEQHYVEFDDAYKFYKNDPYKTAMIDELKEKGETRVSFYKSGNFDNLCAGPHVNSTKEIDPDAFKLTRISGAYWRGDEKNKMLQRIYGVAFTTKEELDQYLEGLKQAKLRDHRKLGKELDIYITSNLVGTGLPLFTPRGTVLRDVFAQLSNQIRIGYGFEKVWTPHITKIDLYKKSGHWDKFGDELFLVTSQETDDKMALKPMNCPHHAQIYASRPRSYKDLPIRYLETTTDYRDEKTGELGGLDRVRSLTQDDSHVFCSPDQVEQEISNLIASANELYSTIAMKLRVRLSYRDNSDAYLGDINLWQSAQKQLKSAVLASNLDYFEKDGEAAFYGPKIDFMATDAIGREHQVATVQLDFVQPKRFDLEYTDADGLVKTPVMIHCAILGSIERFLSVFIEHTAGWFPFWAAPEQVRVLTINNNVNEYVDEIKNILNKVVLMKPIKYNEIRYRIDDRNESLGKKIREATSSKIPMQLIIGPRDVEAKEVSIRTINNEEKVKLENLADYISNYN